MASPLEIVLPLRNPTPVLAKTVRSLTEQTDRDFAVLISDNGTGGGQENLDAALAQLREAGLAVRTVRPPQELGRIEHWNWAHRQTTGDWIKPLFVGDWLAPGYVAATRRQIAAQPAADVVNCSLCSHFRDGTSKETLYPEGYRSPAEVLREAFQKGNNFGGPVNQCYRRLAFDLVGGFPPALPVSGDFWLTLMLALRGGLHTTSAVLGHFDYHPDRFSTNFPYGRINGDRELVTILLAATSYANFVEIPAPTAERNKFFAFLLRRWAKDCLRRFLARGATS